MLTRPATILTAEVPDHGRFQATATVVERLDRQLRQTPLATLRRLVRQTTAVSQHGHDPHLNRVELLMILASADPNN